MTIVRDEIYFLLWGGIYNQCKKISEKDKEEKNKEFPPHTSYIYIYIPGAEIRHVVSEMEFIFIEQRLRLRIRLPRSATPDDAASGPGTIVISQEGSVARMRCHVTLSVPHLGESPL